MHRINQNKADREPYYIQIAKEQAKKATCMRSRCGAIIVRGNSIIGYGYNSPPRDLESQRRCNRKEETPKNFKSDVTCCIHAETRAINDALSHNSDKLPSSTLYFIRIDFTGNILKSKDPYCTYCSKAVLDAGISKFVLLREEGICIYDTDEYNNLSYLSKRIR